MRDNAMIETTTSSAQRGGVLPAYKDWSLAAVRLLQGPVYSDDQAWELTLRYQSAWQLLCSHRSDADRGRGGGLVLLAATG